MKRFLKFFLWFLAVAFFVALVVFINYAQNKVIYNQAHPPEATVRYDTTEAKQPPALPK